MSRTDFDFGTGQLASNPGYYDPLVVDSHSADDGHDLVLAKLSASQEKLPSCKVDETTIADGFCFIGNVCYEDGASHRAPSAAVCQKCNASVSQDSWTIAEGYVPDTTTWSPFDFWLVNERCVFAPFGASPRRPASRPTR